MISMDEEIVLEKARKEILRKIETEIGSCEKQANNTQFKAITDGICALGVLDQIMRTASKRCGIGVCANFAEGNDGGQAGCKEIVNQEQAIKKGGVTLKTEQKTPVSDLEIGRRLAGYPPEFLLYMGLITKKECDRIKRRERHVADWYRYRFGVFQ